MLTDHRCTKYTDCSSCSFYQRDIFKYRLYPKGYVIPQTRCMQNMVFFLVKGEIWLNSEEHPDTTFRGGQFVLQPIGSKVECMLFTAVIWHRVKNYTLTWVCASFLLAWLLAFQNGSAPW